MTLILAVDTSTDQISAAVCDGQRLLAERSAAARAQHNEELAVQVAAVMQSAGVEPAELGLLAVGAGPGSFTGLRVAYSYMKGMALSLRAPLVGISSFAAFAAEFETAARLICVVGDARRSECFYALYESGSAGGPIDAPRIVAAAELAGLVEARRLERGVNESDVFIASVHPELALPSGCRAGRPAHAAEHLARLAARRPALYDIGAVAEETPEYLRAVAAKTIAERAAEKARM